MALRTVVCLAVLAASAPLDAAEKKPFTVDVMWAVQRVGAPALSPDGTQVAYTVSSYDMEENRANGDVWVLRLAGGPPRRLTTNKASDGSPTWSPDGKRLAFVSSVVAGAESPEATKKALEAREKNKVKARVS